MTYKFHTNTNKQTKKLQTKLLTMNFHYLQLVNTYAYKIQNVKPTSVNPKIQMSCN